MASSTAPQPAVPPPSRPALDAHLKREIDGGGEVALAIIDLDNMLELNDGHGHGEGDRVLSGLAAALAEVEGGTAYRVSGDEFAVVLPGHGLEVAFLKMEALRRRVEADAALRWPDGRATTIGIGVAHHPRDAKTARALWQAADVALGAVKEGGRNAVGLPFTEEMVMKSCYYPATALRRLRALGERLGRKDSPLLREALDDLFRKFDAPRD